MTTPTALPKPKTTEEEELTIPDFNINGAKLPGFGEWQRAVQEAAQRRADILALIAEKRREEYRRHAEELRSLDDLERSVKGGKPVKARRPSMPREELELGILATLKTGERSGSSIAESLSLDPNRVAAVLDEMVAAKKVAHNGKEKKASRFSLPK